MVKIALPLLFISSLAAAAAPQMPTYRWAATVTECQTSFDIRSADDRCVVTPSSSKPFTIVAYPPSATDARVQLTRYDGDHAGAPHAWTVYAELGAHALHPVVLVADTTAYVAAVSDGTARLAAFDTTTGRLLHAITAVDHGAEAIQLEAVARQLHAYVRLADKTGRTVVLAPDSLSIVAARDVPAAAIRLAMAKGAQSADFAVDATHGSQCFAARWDGPALVVRAGWTAKLIENDRFRWDTVTLHATADRVVATVHNVIATGTQVFGLDPRTGGELWHIALTGLGPIAHSKYANAVAALVDGDLLVVQSVESAGAYICTVALADGRELACVDHLDATAVIEPDRTKIVLPELPPEFPIGPQVKKQACKKTARPGASLSQVSVKDGTLRAKLVAPSASCKAKLGGGIAGERIELEVYDLSDHPAAAVCECSFELEQHVNPESTTVIATVRGGVEIARQPLVR